MREVHRSALVPFGPESLFSLIADVRAYPRFVPGCTGSEVLSEEGSQVLASLSLARGPLHATFTTRNTLEPHRRIGMELVDGPFRELHGEWLITPLGVDGSRVDLRVRFAFDSRAKDLLLGPVFELSLNGIVDAFVREAHRLHD